MEVESIDRAYIMSDVEHLASIHKACPVMRSECLGGDAFSFTYRVDFTEYERCIVKVYKLSGLNTKEASDLKRLKEACSVKIPEVFFEHSKTLDFSFDALGLEYLNGVSLSFVNPYLLSAKKREQLVDDVICELRHLHETKNKQFGYLSNTVFSSWADFYGFATEECIVAAERLSNTGRLDPYLYKLAKTGHMNLWKIFKDQNFEATLLHSNLNPVNIIVDKKTMELVGFIDPRDAMWGDPEYDLFSLERFNGHAFKFYKNFKKDNQVSDNIDLKSALYAHIYELKRYVESGYKSDERFKRIGKKLEKQFKLHGMR